MYHAAALAIPPKIGRKYAKRAGIEPIRFGSSGTAIDKDTGRLEHVVGNAMYR